jgi:adenine phosphoribosyltransferase
MSETHINDLKFRMMTIDLLRSAKKHFTYRELSAETGLPVTVLSRYVKGHVLPSSSRSKKVWNILERIVGLEEGLRRKIKFDEYGYLDNTSIIYDTALLQQGAQHVFSKFAGRRITKVMTAAVDGVPLATAVAAALGVDIVVAKKNKEVGVQDFIEETYIPGDSAMVMSLYIPRRIIKRGESILIVDDLINTGQTQRAMVELVYKARAEVAGIYALIAIGDRWKKRLDISNYPVKVGISVSKPRRRRR